MKITLGQYLPVTSPVHSLDPRVKFFLMALGIGVAFQIDGNPALGAFALICLVITFIARIPIARLVSGLAPFIWLFFFTAILHVFMTPGDPIPWIPHATMQGLQGGIRVGLQLVFAIWISTLMTLTTSPLDMVWAMEWYLKPLAYLKVPIDEIALLVMLAVRFVPILFEEADRIIKAQKARGIDLESGGLIKRVRSLVPVVVPLLYGVFRRADDLAIALTLRGYTPGLKRSRMKIKKAGVADIGALIVTSAIFVTFIWL